MSFWHFASWMLSWIKSARFARKVCLPRGIVYFYDIHKDDGRFILSKSTPLEELHALTLCCGSTMLELFFVTCSGTQSSLSSVPVYLPDPAIFIICPWAKLNRCVTRWNWFSSWSNPHPHQISGSSLALNLKIHSSTQTSWIFDILFQAEVT